MAASWPYPSFEEWRRASEQCDDEVLNAFHMTEGRRRIIKTIRAIGERLTQATDEYMEWEAFPYRLRSLFAKPLMKLCCAARE
jgi:hypothetical protein